MRKVLLVALAVLVAAALALPASAGPSGQAGTAASAQPSGQLQSANGEYVVAYADGASAAAARAAIKAAGGTIVKENTHVGVATVKSTNPAFIAAAGSQSALVGAARNRPVGKLPSGAGAPRDDVERLTAAERAAAKSSASRTGTPPDQEPLADKQWDMRMIDATPSGSYRVNQGRRGVMVGIIDTGIDGTHPDITPNFNARPEPELHHRHPADRRALRGAVVRRPAGRRRERARHPRGRPGRRPPSTGSARPASRPRSPWSTSGPGRTPGSSSCSPRWTRWSTPGWSGSTSST